MPTLLQGATIRALLAAAYRNLGTVPLHSKKHSARVASCDPRGT